MRGSGRTDEQAPQTARVRDPAAAPSAAARRPEPRAALALRLQRAIGNRAAGRVLARWAKHPDQKQKGVMVPDVVAEDFTRFNPPQNK
jgi:hypothetical protein